MLSVRRGRARLAPARALEHDLHADAHVLVDLGEREVRLASAGSLVLAQAGAADLGEVAEYLADRSVLLLRGTGGARRDRTSAQEALAPERERLHLLIERRVVIGQQRLERRVRGSASMAALAASNASSSAATSAGEAAASSSSRQSLSQRSAAGRSRRAQRTAHAAVQLGERDHGAGVRERVAQAVVVEVELPSSVSRQGSAQLARTVRMLSPPRALLTL